MSYYDFIAMAAQIAADTYQSWRYVFGVVTEE